MVFFTCGSCGDNFKKPKVEKHLSRCRTNELTCIDCNQQFDRVSYDVHKSCMTENERYGDKDYVEKGGKGDSKQKNWMKQIEAAMENAKLSKGASKIWETLQEGGFDNVPRKKAKFLNFLQNSMRIRDASSSAEIWRVFESTFATNPKTPPPKAKAKASAPVITATPGKAWWEQFTGSSEKKSKNGKKEDSSSSSSSESEAEVPNKKQKLVKSSPAKVEPAKPEPKAKKLSKKRPVQSSSDSDSSDEESPPVKQTSPKKKQKTKAPSPPAVKPDVAQKKESSDSSSTSDSETEQPKSKIILEVAPPSSKTVKKESSSSSSGEESEEEPPAKKVTKKTPVTKTPQKATKKDSSSSSSSDESEDEKPVVKVVPKKAPVKAESSDSSGSDSSDAEKETKKVVKKEIANGNDRTKEESSSSGSSEDDSSSDDEPVKKVPFKKVMVKPEPQKAAPVSKEPASVDENDNRRKSDKSEPKTKDDFNKERDSRTIFVKNLPFNSTVDDLWEIFGNNDEETCLDCRFIMNHETGSHKGLAFVEYATAEKATEVIAGKWKVHGRPAHVMQAGGKKPTDRKSAGGGGGNDRDKKTLFVKGLPFSSSPDDLINLFGCFDARILKDQSGKSKGMAFCEFENENDADTVFNNSDGWELDGRWLIVDKLRPKGDNPGPKKDFNSGFKRNFSGKPIGAATKNKGYMAGFEGKKMTFDD